MVTAGHLACGPLTAMRSLSSALGNRHGREGAASHRPVGGGCRDGHDRRHPGRRGPGHADGDQAPACSSDPGGAGRHRGGHRVRPRRPGYVHHRVDQWSGGAPAAKEEDGTTTRSRPPGSRGGFPRAWPADGAGQGSAQDRHRARRRSRPARRRSALRAAARAEPDERLFTGRPHRCAQGRPWIRGAGRRGHPRDPAHRGTRPGSGSPGRRAEPGPAVPGPRWPSAAASWLPAGYVPGWSPPHGVRPGQPAGTSHAA